MPNAPPFATICPPPAEDAPKLNSLTYMNKLSNERWTPEDTELFYKASSQPVPKIPSAGRAQFHEHVPQRVVAAALPRKPTLTHA